MPQPAPYTAPHSAETLRRMIASLSEQSELLALNAELAARPLERPVDLQSAASRARRSAGTANAEATAALPAIAARLGSAVAGFRIDQFRPDQNGAAAQADVTVAPPRWQEA